jgi:hypothetical protein
MVPYAYQHPCEKRACCNAFHRIAKRCGTMGLLVVDDTTLVKPYASRMALVSRHWSGKHHDPVQGINLISLVWTDGNACLPSDFRLYNKAHDGLDKNDYFKHLVRQAKARGFQPSIVAFDIWYSSLENVRSVVFDPTLSLFTLICVTSILIWSPCRVVSNLAFARYSVQLCRPKLFSA